MAPPCAASCWRRRGSAAPGVLPCHSSATGCPTIRCPSGNISIKTRAIAFLFGVRMIYELDGKRPVLKGNNYVAPNAVLIGDVVLGLNTSVWWNCVLRGDNSSITLGDN